MTSAYDLHAGKGEPFGGFMVDQCVDIQRRWGLIRDSVMVNKISQAAGRKSSPFADAIDNFASVAVGALSVDARVQAKRLAEDGVVGSSNDDELLSQARFGVQDTMRMNQFESVEKLKQIKASRASEEKIAEFSDELSRGAAKLSVKGVVEIVQIQFFSGAKEDALDTIRFALNQLAPSALSTGIEVLAKELHWAHGNDQEFCFWASQALKITDLFNGNPTVPSSFSKVGLKP